MTRFLGGFRLFGSVPAALGAVALLPALAGAETLTFRNDTNSSVVLQAACVVQSQGQKTVQRDRPALLQKGESCRVQLPGNKLITLYNPQMPNQVLAQFSIPAGNEDLHFSIRQDPQGRITIERTKPPR
jgi:hypothetical protein